jgi:hypothetical protein
LMGCQAGGVRDFSTAPTGNARRSKALYNC